jgi:hypothetical protein
VVLVVVGCGWNGLCANRGLAVSILNDMDRAADTCLLFLAGGVASDGVAGDGAHRTHTDIYDGTIASMHLLMPTSAYPILRHTDNSINKDKPWWSIYSPAALVAGPQHAPFSSIFLPNKPRCRLVSASTSAVPS